MNSPQYSGPDAARSQLRAMIASVERELARLPGPVPLENSKSPQSGLLASFADLVKQLALGPEPEVRECPVCRHVGMRTATTCGYCWTKLTPPTGSEGVAALP